MDYQDIFLTIIAAWLIALLAILVLYLRTKIELRVPSLLLAEILVITMILLFVYLLIFPSEPSYRS